TPIDNKIDVIYDTNFKDGANDGQLDTIFANVNGGNLQLWFNGVLTDRYPIQNVNSLRIIGSEDDSNIIVDGSVRKPIFVDGGGGTDNLAFNDFSYTSSTFPVYTVTGTRLARGKQSNSTILPFTFDTTIDYKNIEAV